MVSTTLAILATLLLLLLVAMGWMMTLVGLPGNWWIVAVSAGYAWLKSGAQAGHLDWPWIGVLLAMAAVGEVLELVAGAVGTARVGGSRRAAIYALAGSLIGGIAGAVMGAPIPIIGSLVAAVVCGGLGAAGGAIFGEWTHGEQLGRAIRVGHGAFWGRVAGVGAKVLIGSVMVATVVVALFV